MSWFWAASRWAPRSSCCACGIPLRRATTCGHRAFASTSRRPTRRPRACPGAGASGRTASASGRTSPSSTLAGSCTCSGVARPPTSIWIRRKRGSTSCRRASTGDPASRGRGSATWRARRWRASITSSTSSASCRSCRARTSSSPSSGSTISSSRSSRATSTRRRPRRTSHWRSPSDHRRATWGTGWRRFGRRASSGGPGSRRVSDSSRRETAEGYAQLRECRQTTPAENLVDALPDLGPALAEYRRNLAALVAGARSYGAPMLLLTQPTLWAAEWDPPSARASWPAGSAPSRPGARTAATIPPAPWPRGCARSTTSCEACAGCRTSLPRSRGVRASPGRVLLRRHASVGSRRAARGRAGDRMDPRAPGRPDPPVHPVRSRDPC